MKSVQSEKPRLLVLLGPTAVGKTKFSLEIAESFRCEIISGDSMQVYRGMDVGTAKASDEEKAKCIHHMIDICDPDEEFSAAMFQEKARQYILDINNRGALPFIVGGTGLYIESLCYSYQFSQSSRDEAFREEMQAVARKQGTALLHQRLQSLDSDSAARIHPNDERRIIRALEVIHQTGRPISRRRQPSSEGSAYRLCLVGLYMERQRLYRRIEERVDRMMEQGLLEEVRTLLQRGYSPQLVSMQGLGYKELIQCIQGEYDRDEAVRLLKRNTRRFAKRQLSWFRHMKEIHWIDVTDGQKFYGQLHEINGIIARKFSNQPGYEGEVDNE